MDVFVSIWNFLVNTRLGLNDLQAVAAILIGWAYWRNDTTRPARQLAQRFNLTLPEAKRLFSAARDPVFLALRSLGGLGFVAMGLSILAFHFGGASLPPGFIVYGMLGTLGYGMVAIGLLALFKGETIARLRRLRDLATSGSDVSDGVPSLKPEGADVIRIRFIGLLLLGMAGYAIWKIGPTLLKIKL
jgi:hypothetical protein